MRIKTSVARRKVAAQFIMTSPELALMPGLFRHISAADQHKYQIALRVEYPHGGKLIKVTGGYLLSGFDLAVLQALELISVGNGDLVDAAADDVESKLRAKIGCKVADNEPAVELAYATCSVSQLLKLVGMPINDTYVTQAGKSLERLFGITLSIAADARKPQVNEQFHLLAYTETGEGRTNALHVAFNPMLTAALTGSARQDIRLLAAELKLLGTDHAARILHQRLCAIVNDGRTRRFAASTLYSYLFPDDKSAHDLAILRQRTALGDYQASKRQQYVLSAAVEGLKCLDWTIELERGSDEDMVVISRPKCDWTYEALAARRADANATQPAASVAVFPRAPVVRNSNRTRSR